MVQAMTKEKAESKAEVMSKPLDQGDTANKRKILVTGATGFVGQAFCQGLIGRGFDVQILLRDPATFSKIPLELGASIIMGSLDNDTSLAVACAGQDYIIHLAGVAHVGEGSVKRTKETAQTNLLGIQNLLAAAINANVGRLVFLSSSLAEAAAAGQGDITEYGKSKLQAERLLQEAAAAGLIDVAILRAVNVYGPGMKGNIHRMISMISRGRLPPLPKINNRISLVSAHDLSRALLLALKSSAPNASPITITDGQQYSISDIEQGIYLALGRSKPRWRTPHMVLYCAASLAGLISIVTGSGSSISSRTYRNLTSDNLFSNDKARSLLGFEPSTTFYQSLPAIVQQIRENTQ
jgi:nucleoside-diphosphate-sugar epimerase